MRDFCCAAACVLALLPTLALAQELTGPARVIDGDTIAIGTTHVRLHGIDAPGADQTCGIGAQVYASAPSPRRLSIREHPPRC